MLLRPAALPTEQNDALFERPDLTQDDYYRLGADGVVIDGMRMRVRQRDCPQAVGRRDHIVEVTFTGTGIAGFSGRSVSGPMLAVMAPRTAAGFSSALITSIVSRRTERVFADPALAVMATPTPDACRPSRAPVTLR